LNNNHSNVDDVVTIGKAWSTTSISNSRLSEIYCVVECAKLGGTRAKDHCAKWISEFTMQTGDEPVFKIEVKTILEGLKITWGSEFQQVEVECDNNLVVECATNSKM
ncbi:hypothetical protein Goklo_029596, partial [Gossypium klotzschianum]|nr:hypothetical protein [Gossypium klotzschianum]